MSEQMTQYQKDLVRMWDSLRLEYKGASRCDGTTCEICPLYVCCYSDHENTLFAAEKVIEIVNSWAKEHPIVTYEQKYEETFGVKPINDSGEYFCPSYLGSKPGKYLCGNGSPCTKCAKDFWHSEYKGPKKEGE